MPAWPQGNNRYLTWLFAALPLVAGVSLCAFQFGDRNGLNSMPFAQVQPLVSDLAKARQMADQGNIELLARQSLPGKEVSLRGELTDANCFLATHTHAYDHAFCAKLCAAAGTCCFCPIKAAIRTLFSQKRTQYACPTQFSIRSASPAF